MQQERSRGQSGTTFCDCDSKKSAEISVYLSDPLGFLSENIKKYIYSNILHFSREMSFNIFMDQFKTVCILQCVMIKGVAVL